MNKSSVALTLRCFSLLILLFWAATTAMAQQPGSLGAWNSTASLPNPVEGPAAVAYQGHVYVLGGRVSPSGQQPYLENVVYMSTVNADGTLQSWQSTSPFANGRYLHAAVGDSTNGVLYVIGGATSTSSNTGTADVQFAHILPGGVGIWTATTPLPTALSGHSAIIYGGYLYVFGGLDGNGNVLASYFYAPLNPDGGVGAWAQGHLTLAQNTAYGIGGPRRYPSSFGYNGHLYVSGGLSPWGNVPLGDVQVALVPPSASRYSFLMHGETEEWKAVSAFQTARYFHGTASENRFVYVVGGETTPGSPPDRSDVQYAEILNDGTLGTWMTGTALPSARSTHACLTYGGRIYVIGGDVPTSGAAQQTASVLYAVIQSASDTTPPKTQVSPPPGPQPSNSVNVTLTATDIGGSGIASIRYTKDGTDPNTSLSATIVISNSTTVSLPIPSTLKFSAIDLAENQEPVQSATYSALPSSTYVSSFQFPSDSRYLISPLIEQKYESLQYDQLFVEELSDPIPNHHYYRVAQDFGQPNYDVNLGPNDEVSRHLGEDWNWGSNSDDYKMRVHAIAQGTVIYAGVYPGFGRVMMIKHILPPSFPDVPADASGTKFIVSLCGHLGSDPGIWKELGIRSLQVGDKVEGGEAIGYVGNTSENGSTSTSILPPHFHLEIRLPSCPILNSPGPGYFPRAAAPDRSAVPDPTGWVDPSAFIKLHRASLLSLQVINSGGLTDIAQTMPVVSASGSSVGFKHSPTYHLVDFDSGYVKQENSDAEGSLGNGGMFASVFSADSSIKAFASDDVNLVPGDTNGVSDVFVWSRDTGVTERVNISTAGEQANGASYDAAISADGRYVAFTSVATNLVSGDSNGVSDIFVRDRQTGTTIRVSVDSSGGQANGPSYSPSMSADGRYVAFVSEASNQVAGDANGVADIFVHGLQTGTSTRISMGLAGAEANGPSRQPSISGDGRYVAFESLANNLIPNDSNGFADVFLYDRETSTVQRISVGPNGEQGNEHSREPRISSYGLRIAFISEASNLVANDTNGLPDVFVASFSSVPTVLVSTSASPSAGGTTTGDGSFTNGANVTVIATANSGYTFTNWTEGGTVVSTLSSYQFTVTSDRTLVANFVPSTPASTVTSVSVSPSTASINAGGTQQFAATVNGTGSPSQSVTWSANGGSVNSSGLYTAPGTTGSYTVTATSIQDGTKSGSASVTVTTVPAPVINAFTATPAAFQPGGSVTLAWSVTGTVTSLSINGGVGDVTGQTSKSVSPTGTSDITFTLTASNAGVQTTRSVVVAYRPKDISGDGATDVIDLARLAQAYGLTTAAGDLNGDGIVDDNDLTIFLTGF